MLAAMAKPGERAPTFQPCSPPYTCFLAGHAKWGNRGHTAHSRPRSAGLGSCQQTSPITACKLRSNLYCVAVLPTEKPRHKQNARGSESSFPKALPSQKQGQSQSKARWCWLLRASLKAGTWIPLPPTPREHHSTLTSAEQRHCQL